MIFQLAIARASYNQVLYDKHRLSLAPRDWDLDTFPPTVNISISIPPFKKCQEWHSHRTNFFHYPLEKKKNYEIEECFCEVDEIANVKSDLCYNDIENVHNWHLRKGNDTDYSITD